MSSNNLLKESSIPLQESELGDGTSLVQQLAGDFAIRVQNVSKCYQIYNKPEDRLKQAIYPRLRRMLGKEPRSYARDFWALKDISFDVKKGETVGIIGRNGSGKSTLLQIIAGTLAATAGQVHVNGRVAALLELGSGFNLEFTGRENVYMNAAIHGLSHAETNAKFEDIAAFADIGDFLDQPIKTYSSGMMMRLAFAVNACIEPDILIVDEALGVGDAPFQSKCYKRLRRLVDEGKSILFVSHDIGTVRSICSRVVWLKGGCVEMWGAGKDVSKEYELFCYQEQGIDISPLVHGHNDNITQVENLSIINDGSESEGSTINLLFAPNPTFNSYYAKTRYGTGAVAIKNFLILDKAGTPVASCEYDEELTFTYLLLAHTRIESDILLGLLFRDLKGNDIYAANDLHAIHRLEGGPGDYFIASAKLKLPLHHQQYQIMTSILGYQTGVALQGDAYDFTNAIIFDAIEEAAFLEVKPYRMPLRGPVHASAKVSLIKLQPTSN